MWKHSRPNSLPERPLDETQDRRKRSRSHRLPQAQLVPDQASILAGAERRARETCGFLQDLADSGTGRQTAACGGRGTVGTERRTLPHFSRCRPVGKIGRASCRERVYVEVDAVAVKMKVSLEL